MTLSTYALAHAHNCMEPHNSAAVQHNAKVIQQAIEETKRQIFQKIELVYLKGNRKSRLLSEALLTIRKLEVTTASDRSTYKQLGDEL